MTMSPHEPFEELISASLAGDLSADERQRLDAHLDTCADCRATLAAFADQRRIMAGLRHVPPPRDLGARVRTGIEDGSHALPWWRRPPAIFAGLGGGLAVVAGALLALVLLNGAPDGPPVGEASATASVAILPSTTPAPTLPPTGTPAPSTPGPSTAPSIDAGPSPPPIPASPEPDVYLALTGPFDDLELTVRDGTTDATVAEADPPSGPPIAAQLSPDGQWLAYITEIGERGVNEVRATRIADTPERSAPDAPPPIDSPVAVGGTVTLGESVAGSPFLELLSWSADGRYLAYTLADPEADGTDVWVFGPGLGEPRQLTDVGNAYAGSWVPGTAGTPALWVSIAGAEPTSHLMTFHDDAAEISPGDPSDSPFDPALNVFQPLVSPNGALVIFWSGRMQQSGAEWVFSEGGAPWLAENQDDGDGGYEFTNGRELFSDVTIDRDAFTSAAITWGPDGDAFAVWDAAWTGLPQAPDEDYPDPSRVYFGHATDARGLTRFHAIDDGDVPEGGILVDVKVSPTGRHLVVTALRPRGGIGDSPRADLLLVTRNTGSVPDDIDVIGSADDGWFGPAAFDDYREIVVRP